MTTNGTAAHSATMKAGRWNPEQQKIEIVEKPIPEPGPNQARIKIACASLCHSDILSIELGMTVTLGHEGAGYIDTLNPSIEGKGFAHGDRVGFLYINGCCFECDGCKIHNTHCEKGTAKLLGWFADGFFAEYALVDFENLIHLPENVDVNTASPLFCAGITAFHAVDNSELQPGDWLGVIGAGGLGQLATQIGKAMGCKVVALDVNDATLEVCKKQGADAVFNSLRDKDYVEKLKKLTNGGVKAACVFSNVDAAYAGVPSILRLGGVYMVVGLPHNPLQISSMDLALGKYRIKSVNTGTPKQMPKAVKFLAQHDIKPEVELHKIEDLDDMVKAMRSGKATKRMLVQF